MTDMLPMVIAVDGPAASGKGTLAKRIAASLGLPYLDTGRLYRTVGYLMISRGFDPEDTQKAMEVAHDIHLVDLENTHLYDEGVGQAASVVSAIPEVRAALLDFQKDFAHQPQGAVLDGRDIGTVICPDANYKFYITADLATRAKRRYKQLQNSDASIIYESVLHDLERRDARDSTRSIAPLKPAAGAIIIDTSGMEADDVFANVMSMIKHQAPSPNHP